MNDILVSFVIPTLDEEKYLGTILNAICNCKFEKSKFEIIVVDNGSTDHTIKIAKSYGVRILHNPKPGAAASRNLGAKEALGSFIAFVDADCVVPSEWLARLMENFRKPHVVAIAARTCPDFTHATWVEKSWYNVFIRSDTDDDISLVDWVGTSNLLIKKDIFFRVGGFSEDLITCEDYDLCSRIHGLGILLIDERIHTIHLRESKTLKELFIREYFRGSFSLRSWQRHNYIRSEGMGVIAPALFCLSLVSCMVLVFFFWQVAVIFFLAALFLPVYLIVRGQANLNMSSFLCDFAVAWVYIFARGCAFFRELSIVIATHLRQS